MSKAGKAKGKKGASASVSVADEKTEQGFAKALDGDNKNAMKADKPKGGGGGKSKETEVDDGSEEEVLQIEEVTDDDGSVVETSTSVSTQKKGKKGAPASGSKGASKATRQLSPEQRKSFINQQNIKRQMMRQQNQPTLTRRQQQTRRTRNSDQHNNQNDDDDLDNDEASKKKKTEIELGFGNSSGGNDDQNQKDEDQAKAKTKKKLEDDYDKENIGSNQIDTLEQQQIRENTEDYKKFIGDYIDDKISPKELHPDLQKAMIKDTVTQLFDQAIMGMDSFDKNTREHQTFGRVAHLCQKIMKAFKSDDITIAKELLRKLLPKKS